MWNEKKGGSTKYIKQNGCNEGTPAGHECLRINSDEIETEINQQQCNLDFVTLLISAKTVTKSHNVTKSNDFMKYIEK